MAMKLFVVLFGDTLKADTLGIIAPIIIIIILLTNPLWHRMVA